MHLTLMLFISNTSLNFNEFFLSFKEPPVLFPSSAPSFLSSKLCCLYQGLLLTVPSSWEGIQLSPWAYEAACITASG